MTRQRLLVRLAEQHDRLTDVTLDRLLLLTDRLAAQPANCRPIPLKAIPRTPLDAIGARFPQFFVATPAGTIVNISAAAARLLDAPVHDLCGRNWMDLVVEDQQAFVGERWMVAAQTKADFSYTTKCRTPRGALVYLFVKLTAVFNEHDPREKMFYVGTIEPQAFPLRVLVSRKATA